MGDLERNSVHLGTHVEELVLAQHHAGCAVHCRSSHAQQWVNVYSAEETTKRLELITLPAAHVAPFTGTAGSGEAAPG